MFSITSCPLPDTALLNKYAGTGAYTDCYCADISCTVTHTQFVNAFYTTPVFKLERLILKWLVSKPSSDQDVIKLAHGEASRFAAWHVEDRRDNQLLMCDDSGRTRSWLMVAQISSDGVDSTRLYFGSAVIPVRHPKTGRNRLGAAFTALLGFHKFYSIVLLYAARSRLMSVDVRGTSANTNS